MAGILATWEQIKKDFAAAAAVELKSGSLPADYSAALKKVATTDTGLTPALKEFDAAISKKERKPAMTGLTKLHMVIEKIRKPIDDLISLGGNKVTDQELIAKKTKDPADKLKWKMLNDFVETIFTYKKGILNLEAMAAKAIETLQVEKSPVKKKIDIISLEGDMKGALDKFKSDVKAFTAEEKHFKALAKTEALTKSMQAYSKAAARTEVKAALVALDQFFVAIGEMNKVLNNIDRVKPTPPAAYKQAMVSFCKALDTIKKQRGEVSHKNLKALEAEGVA